eukprot:scaffold9484_cov124-Isochrysis_galbana.AAC.1
MAWHCLGKHTHRRRMRPPWATVRARSSRARSLRLRAAGPASSAYRKAGGDRACLERRRLGPRHGGRGRRLSNLRLYTK